MMYIVHIWSNHEPFQSLEYQILSKNLAQLLVNFSHHQYTLISEVSSVDYELITDLDTLLDEFHYFHQQNTNFSDEILSIIKLIQKAKNNNHHILFDPFENTPYK